MKVPVEFDVNFETDEVIPITIGRFTVGERYIVRLILDKDGRVKLLIPQEAIDGEAVLVGGRPAAASLVGFGKQRPTA